MMKKYEGTAPLRAAPVSCEVWRDIPGFEGAYQASSMGRVRSLPRYIPVYDSVRRITHVRSYPGLVLHPSVCDTTGHVAVHLGIKSRGIPVHQLVMLAFCGFPPAGMEVMHLNGIPDDNRLENLRYGTHSENMIAVAREGRGASKLSPEEVRQIRFWLSAGWPSRRLAAAYGVSKNCILRIRKGRHYAWVDGGAR